VVACVCTKTHKIASVKFYISQILNVSKWHILYCQKKYFKFRW